MDAVRLLATLAANAIIRERARLRGHDPDAIKRCISRASEAIKNSRILLDRVEARQRAEEWHCGAIQHRNGDARVSQATRIAF
jgi:hypothetical protein